MSKRSPLILALPCIACIIEDCEQPNRTEEHHLNLGGNAGQKRRGDEFSIPLCGWHHRAEPIHDLSKSQMTSACGPSLASNSKDFRAAYGSDDSLLDIANDMVPG